MKKNTKYILLWLDQTPSTRTAAAQSQRQLNFSDIFDDSNESNQSTSKTSVPSTSKENTSSSATSNAKKQRKNDDDCLTENLSIQRESYKLQNEVLLLQKQKLQIGVKTAELQYDKEKRLAELEIAIKEKELANMSSK